MKKSRGHTFTAAQKAEVVRRHLAEKVALSDLAAELNLQPSQSHQCGEQVIEQAEQAFQKPRKGGRQAEARKAIGPPASGKAGHQEPSHLRTHEENVKAKKAEVEL